jgi:hypothetical protein
MKLWGEGDDDIAGRGGWVEGVIHKIEDSRFLVYAFWLTTSAAQGSVMNKLTVTVWSPTVFLHDFLFRFYQFVLSTVLSSPISSLSPLPSSPLKPNEYQHNRLSSCYRQHKSSSITSSISTSYIIKLINTDISTA